MTSQDIKNIRERFDLTQEEFAKMLNVSKTNLAKCEMTKNCTQPKGDLLIKLEYLNKHIDLFEAAKVIYDKNFIFFIIPFLSIAVFQKKYMNINSTFFDNYVLLSVFIEVISQLFSTETNARLYLEKINLIDKMFNTNLKNQIINNHEKFDELINSTMQNSKLALDILGIQLDENTLKSKTDEFIENIFKISDEKK